MRSTSNSSACSMARAMPTTCTTLATRYQCRTVVLTPQDGAWANDPFAASGDYTLADEKPQRWKIYRAK